MPQALKMQEQFGDDVQYLFATSGTPEEIEHFALTKKWINDFAMWATEYPFETGSNTIPHTVVLGIDGDVIFNGKPCKQVEDLVAEQLKLAKKGPKNLPAPLQKAWSDFNAGNFAAAIKSLDDVKDGPDKDAAKKLADSLTTRLKAKLARLGFLIDGAEFDSADKLAGQLTKGLAGNPLAEKAKELADTLVAKDMEKERDAAKALDKLQKRIAKDGLDAAVTKALNGFAEKYPNTKAAKRASHLAKVATG